MQETRQTLAYRELEWRKCKADPVYFINTFCKMWVKEGGEAIDWKLWAPQEIAIRKMQVLRLIILLKTRQLGMSWTACGYVLWRVMFEENIQAYFRSIGLVEAIEQHERIKFIYDHLPEWMQEKSELGGKRCKRNDRQSQFQNGSSVNMVTSSKKAGHGTAPSIYIWDEAARDENDVHAIRSIMPAVGEVAQFIIISTANGFGNTFQKMWYQAKSGDSNFEPLFFGWRDHPYYTPEYIERERLNFLGDPVGFAEAYPETWQDAFMTSSKCPFDLGRINESINYIEKNKIEPTVGFLEYEDDFKTVKFTESTTGSLQIFKHPVIAGKGRKQPHDYSIGADVAQGLAGGDFSAAIVYDETTNEVVALLRGKWAPEFYAWPLELLAVYYNNAFLAVEVNINADTIIGDLKRSYHNLYRRERREKIYDAPTLEPGFLTTGRTKSSIITGLRKAFHSTVKPLRIYSKIVLSEMTTYEENDNKYAASGSNFDDTVMALAIALEAARTMPDTTHYEPKRRPHWRSL